MPIPPSQILNPNMKADTQKKVNSRDNNGSRKPVNQQLDQPCLKDKCVEKHQEDNDDIEEDSDVLYDEYY